MNEPGDFVSSKRLKHGVFIHIHDFHGFLALVAAAFIPVPTGIKLSEPQRFTQGIRTPLSGAHFDPGFLILNVIGTKKIAMRQKREVWTKLDDLIVPEKHGAGLFGEAFSY